MNSITTTTGREDGKMPVKALLSALWAALMFLSLIHI